MCKVAPQDSENCGRNFAKHKQSDAEFAGNRLLRSVITDIINTLLGRVTRHPAGMHCPAWDDAFVSSLYCFHMFIDSSYITVTLGLQDSTIVMNKSKINRL